MTTARARPIIPRRHRYTLGGRYELASILITGSCEDITSRDPPNGLQATPPRGPNLIAVGGSTHSPPSLQLHLGSGTDTHVTDTLVMSNLGYFQLKAAPGVWSLQLAPETPSSQVWRSGQW